MKETENVSKNVPQFVHVRKLLYSAISPHIRMTFAFKNLTDGSIHYVEDDRTPLAQYQRDPRYEKLYEEAHIEVICGNLYLLLSKYECIFTDSQPL